MVDKFNLTLEQNIFLAKKGLATIIFNSAKLEGLNITFPDTQTILDGVNVSHVKLADITTTLNLRDAWQYVMSNIEEPLTLDYISRINGFVSRNESLEWGTLRTGQVGITGTAYVPKIPNKEEVITHLEELLNIPDVTLRAIKIILYGMRQQLFWDGNKRTSMVVANKVIIENGKGIITIAEKALEVFNKLLTEFYDTNNEQPLIDFIYNNCIFGIEFIN